MMCTNFGPAFSRDGSPSDSKVAMIDRSIVHLVRSTPMATGSNDDDMNKKQEVDVAKKGREEFRLFVCLVGATRLAIKAIPCLQPDMSYAHNMFEKLDQMLEQEYNLPRCSARKSLKRAENLKTMCCMSAVTNVFMNKEQAVEWESGRLGPDGKPQPFK